MGEGFLACDHLRSEHDDAVETGRCTWEIGKASDELASCAICAVDLIHHPYIVVLGGVPADKVLYIDVVGARIG